MPLEHWMMFSTFAEQDYFIYPRQDACAGVILNANMAAHAPAGLANFVVGKLSEHKYIIDPITHAFQHDPVFIKNDKGDVKASIKVLADAYGEPVSSKAGKKPLLPKKSSRNCNRGFHQQGIGISAKPSLYIHGLFGRCQVSRRG